MKITVVVPTYLRIHDLSRCLAALKQQIRPVDELWVIVRDTDRETWQFLENYNCESLPLHIAPVTASGVDRSNEYWAGVRNGRCCCFY